MVYITSVLIPAMPAIVVLFAAVRPYTVHARASAPDLLFIFSGIVTGGLLFAAVATRRADLPHILYLSPLFAFAVPAVFREGSPAHHLRAFKPAVAAALFACFTMFSVAVQWPSMRANEIVRTRRGTVRMLAKDEALTYIQDNLPAGSKLLVHPYHPLFSFLTATENPTHYEYLQPGMHTPEQFREVARQVAEEKFAGVLLDVSFLAKVPLNWPSTPAAVLAEDPVTDYILSHYHPCKILGASNHGTWTTVYMAAPGIVCPERLGTTK